MRINASPWFIPDTGDAGLSVKTEPVSLSGHMDGQSFSEDQLQTLIFDHPELLPVSAVEPYFNGIIPVCRELPTPAGPLDNLYVTPQGNLILVECKLWRNPEARRKVIAQIMDYAKEIAMWGYQDLMDAINRANKTDHANPLYSLAEKHPETPAESQFVEQVSRNLRLGRHMLLIVGDGIQEGAEKLAEFLQQNMALQFTLALVQMGIYRFPERQGHIVIPHVLMKTTMIERAVIRIEDGKIRVTEPDNRPQSAGSTQRAENLSEIEFFESLSGHHQESAVWLRRVLKRMEEMGMTWEVKRSLLPRYSPDGEQEFSFGYFKPDGRFFTDNAVWGLSEPHNLRNLAVEYIRSVAAIVPDSTVDTDEKDPKVRVNGRILNITDLLGKEDAFIKAIAGYIDDINIQLAKKR